MTNLPTKPNEGLVAFGAMPPEQQRARMISIAKIARAILSRFWADDAEPDEFRIFEIETWQDVLRSVSPDEIRAAWVDYQTTGPRTKSGTLARPDAGALHIRVMAARRAVARSALVAATDIPSQAVTGLVPPAEDMTKWRMQ